MKVLVTGGAGFIGSNFLYHMRAHAPEAELVCMDKLTYAGNLATLQPLLKAGLRFYRSDIADRKAVFAVFEAEKPDVVVNFAAESHVDRSIEAPSVFLETNVMGTQVLLDACRHFGVQRFHQVSTDEDLRYSELIRFGKNAAGVLTLQTLACRQTSVDPTTQTELYTVCTVGDQPIDQSAYDAILAKAEQAIDYGYEAGGVFLWEDKGYGQDILGFNAMLEAALAKYVPAL